MRLLIAATIFVYGAFAYGDKIQCSNPGGSNAMIYNPEKMTVSFIKLNGTVIGQPREIAISGEIASRAGLTDDYSIFAYPLANGQTAEITWVSGESETLRGLRGTATEALVKDSGGLVVDQFANCRWIDRN